MTRRGFTLMEAAVSLIVVAVLAAALVSTMRIGLRAMPQPGDFNECVRAARRAADLLSADLAEMIRLDTLTTTSICVVSADRDGDGLEEKITYSWSGAAGDPLQRDYNGVVSTVAADVRQFSLDFLTYPEEIQVGASPVEQPSATLAGWDLTPDSSLVLGTPKIAQAIRPRLDSAATSWRITRVRVRARQYGLATESVALQICRDNAGVPGAVVEQVSVAELAMNALADALVTYSFSGSHNFAPEETVWLVLSPSAAGAARVPYQSTGIADARSGLAMDSGSGWVLNPAASLCFDVDGCVSKATPLLETDLRGASAAVRIRVGENPATLVSSGVVIPAAPNLGPAPVAPADSDPLLIDVLVRAVTGVPPR